jgi:hypothetical protein
MKKHHPSPLQFPEATKKNLNFILSKRFTLYFAKHFLYYSPSVNPIMGLQVISKLISSKL